MQRSFQHAYRQSARIKIRGLSSGPPSPEVLRAQVDFGFFCEHLTRNSPEPKIQPEHMKLWNETLFTGVDSPALLGIAGPNTDILSPRGSAKSTFFGMFLAFMIGRHALAKKALQILYISYTVDVARPKSAAIKAIINSFEYREIFPCVIPGDKWSDEYWSIDHAHAGIPTLGAESFTLCCTGLRGGAVSKRTHLIVLDDIIKSEKDIEAKEIRDEMQKTWTRAIAPTMFDGGRAICLGTRFRADDIHTTAFNSARWLQIEQSAILLNEDGSERSYWDFWSLSYLQALREEDPVGFSYQYQNKIVRVAETSINPDWFVRESCDPDPHEYDTLVIGIDLASSMKEKSDYTVMTLAGRRNGRYYILDGRRGRWIGNIQKLNELIDLWEDWGEPPCRILVESVAYQSSFAGDFRQYVVNRLGIHSMSCSGVSVKGDKMQRLRGISGLFESKLIVFNEERKLGAWIDELENFGSAAHDDCVDSLVITLNGMISRARLQTA